MPTNGASRRRCSRPTCTRWACSIDDATADRRLPPSSPLQNRAPKVGFPKLAAPRPSDPPDDGTNYCSDAVRGVLKVTVETKTTALPANLSVLTPRCGSSENVIITIAAGFCRCGARLRKSCSPYIVVRMKPCALGLTIMARSHGSLKRSPTRTRFGPFGFSGAAGGAATDGRASLRLTATVVSAGGGRGSAPHRRAPPGAGGGGGGPVGRQGLGRAALRRQAHWAEVRLRRGRRAARA